MEWRRGEEDYAGAALVISIRCGLCQALEPETKRGGRRHQFRNVETFRGAREHHADLAFGRQPGTLNRSRGTSKTEGGLSRGQ